jgi:serine-type D-Ala-D-Ala carboxypeptidase (penicillin-binding protein 5/6)
MRRALFAAAVLAALVASLVAPVHASSREAASAVAPLQVSAQAWYLVGEDGAVLAKHNAGERRAVASITKLMTAVVTLEHARLAEIVTVPTRSAEVGGSTAFLRAGERLPVASLLRGMLVASANDAAEALALHVGRGSLARFVALMNEKAEVLGLDETTFVNPHGLDEPGHLSSAEDATALIRHALGIPFIRDALDRSSVAFPSGRVIPTTDDLLQSWPPLIGGKTGHTAQAGWSQAAAARARGVTVYGAVLGADNRTERNEALQGLLSYGLARYRRIVAVDASRVYAEAETGWDRPSVELVAPRTVLRTLREGKALVERVVVPGVVGLPVRRGQRVGRVDAYDGNHLVASSPLVAAEAVSEPGLLGKTAWYARRTASNLWGLLS